MYNPYPSICTIICLFFLFLGACAERAEPYDFNLSEPSLIFGHFYGLCGGEACVETFLLKNAQVYEDTLDNYRIDEFSFVLLSQSQYEIAKVLLEDFPTTLLQVPDSTFGCPDCYDQGGLLLIYTLAGEEHKWIFDQNKDDIPTSFRSYVDEVNQVINELQ